MEKNQPYEKENQMSGSPIYSPDEINRRLKENSIGTDLLKSAEYYAESQKRAFKQYLDSIPPKNKCYNCKKRRFFIVNYGWRKCSFCGAWVCKKCQHFGEAERYVIFTNNPKYDGQYAGILTASSKIDAVEKVKVLSCPCCQRDIGIPVHNKFDPPPPWLRKS